MDSKVFQRDVLTGVLLIALVGGASMLTSATPYDGIPNEEDAMQFKALHCCAGLS